MQNVRSKYQLTLGQFIGALDEADPEAIVVVEKPELDIDEGSDEWHYLPDWVKAPGRCAIKRGSSYRGYYEDFAFSPEELMQAWTVADLLKYCCEILGSTEIGYKGGNYVMKEDTPLWVSEYGDCDRVAMISVEEYGEEQTATGRPELVISTKYTTG